MKTFIKFSWIPFLLVIAVTISLMFTAPNLQDLVKEKGAVTIPSDYSSVQADKILSKYQKSKGAGRSVIVVFHQDKKISDSNQQLLSTKVKALQQHQKEYHIRSITSSFLNKDLKNQLVSKNGHSIIVQFVVDATDNNISDVAKTIEQQLKVDGIKVAATSQGLINADLNESSEAGLQKTEYITVVFILIVLVIVFRSVVAPLIPLITVGVTYLFSQSIVSYLVKYVDFPISNYTQTFLVAILFGIGTDYCILLLSRYKEELDTGLSKEDAIVETYKTAGKTVLYAGVAVLIGFVMIGFAKFSIYQSAVGVAIGIVALLIALFTLVPFFMKVFGNILFWPSKKSAEHGESAIWRVLGRFSLQRSFLSVIIVLVVTIPFILAHQGKISFNSLEEISDSYDSVRGLNYISEDFGAGEAYPVKVVIHGSENLKTSKELQNLESLSDTLSKVKGVKNVRSVTRPEGDKLDELYVGSQAGQLSSGLKKSESGLSAISSGLQQMSEQINTTNTAKQMDSAYNTINQLSDAIVAQTKAIRTNIGQLSESQVSAQLNQIANVSAQIATINKQLQSGSASSFSGVKQIKDNLLKSKEGIDQTAAGLAKMESYTDNLAKSGASEKASIHVTDDVIKNKAFQASFNHYFFDQNKGTTFEIILSDNPYSNEAIDTVNRLDDAVNKELKHTDLKNNKIAFSGVSSTNRDLKSVSDEDYQRTVIFVIIGITIALMFIFRSVLMPLYITASLLLTYFSAQAITEIIFTRIAHYSGISWAVPFFGFVLLVALGVDYSIFLMSRFVEYKGEDTRQAIFKAMKSMGSVILSAAIILAGTFAAMMPSGVLTLLQIATFVLIGLLLYAFFVLPLFVPAVVKWFGKYNFWPFAPKDNKDN